MKIILMITLAITLQAQIMVASADSEYFDTYGVMKKLKSSDNKPQSYEDFIYEKTGCTDYTVLAMSSGRNKRDKIMIDCKR